MITMFATGPGLGDPQVCDGYVERDSETRELNMNQNENPTNNNDYWSKIMADILFAVASRWMFENNNCNESTLHRDIFTSCAINYHAN
jgi:hypothetical protein